MYDVVLVTSCIVLVLDIYVYISVIYIYIYNCVPCPVLRESPSPMLDTHIPCPPCPVSLCHAT